jgi:hypothetical protein
MSKQARSYFQRPLPYRRRTQRPLNSLLLLLPMLLIFHLGNLWWRTDLLAWQDIYRVLAFVGVTASWLPPIVVAIVLLVQHMLHRDPWQLQGLTLLGMVGESAVGVVPLMAMGALTDRIWAQATGSPAGSVAQQIVSGVGAAVYEEFVFRMIFIGLVLLIFVDLLELDKHVVGTVAVMVSATVFSLYHFDRPQLSAELFPWKDFIFRALAGAYLGVVFLTRGLGVASGVHALYNIYVTLH